jgi:hypothetical protein
MLNKRKKCSICKKEICGYDNNAEPVNKGKCCNDCNITKVIPARLKQINDSKKMMAKKRW